MRSTATRAPRPVLLAAVVAILSLTIVAPASARSSPPTPQGSAPGACPDIVGPGDYSVGDEGTGWTTISGHNPKPFHFKILGSIHNGIANGEDMIIVKTSDAPGQHFMSKIGGIWAGISGSPVYLNGKLLGSTSYGFSAAPTQIAGITPAHDMVTLLGYSDIAAAIASPKANRVTVPSSMRAQLAREAGVTEAQASSFSRLRLPLSVSGLSDTGRQRLQAQADKLGWSVMVTRGGSAPTPSGTSFQTPKPGGNFVGVLSYGDATSYATGTTTYVCGDQAIAFGHPFTFLGKTTFGASNGNALTIIKDTSFGPYKLADVGGLFGMLDQDRTLGVRAALGEMPPFIPIDSHLQFPDLGTVRDGHSDLTSDIFLQPAVATQAFNEILTGTDQLNGGVANLTMVVNGHRANGDPFTLTRPNRYASQFDIPDEAGFDITGPLNALQNNPFEKVTFDSVSIDGRVVDTYRSYSIVKVLVSKNGGTFKERQHMNIVPGDVLTFRVRVRPFQAPLQTKEFSMTIPSDASGELNLSIYGGLFAQSTVGCENDPTSCGANSFNQLLNKLNHETRNDDLIADLTSFGGFGAASVRPQDTGPGTGSTGPLERSILQLNAVVSGEVDISVTAP